jgi:hypothetical protein
MQSGDAPIDPFSAFRGYPRRKKFLRSQWDPPSINIAGCASWKSLILIKSLISVSSRVRGEGGPFRVMFYSQKMGETRSRSF